MYIVPPLINARWFEKYGGPFPRFTNLNDSKITEKNIQVIEYKFTDNKTQLKNTDSKK
jgi:hypothetical protein